MAGFVSHLGHDDASRVTRQDVLRSKDLRLPPSIRVIGLPISAKTVKDSDLAASRRSLGGAKVKRKMTRTRLKG